MSEENLFGVAVCYFLVGLLFAILGLVRLGEGDKSFANNLENYERLEVDLFNAYPKIPQDIEAGGTDTAS